MYCHLELILNNLVQTTKKRKMRDICYETIRKDRYHTKNKNRQNVLELEIWGAFFVHCSILSIVYQYESMVFYNFTPKGGFGKSLEIKL